MMDRYYPLLSFYSTPLPPDSSAPPPHPASSQSDQRARTRPTTYETCDAGQQVRLSAPNFSDPNIHLTIPYSFHFRSFFFPIIPPSVMPPPVFYWILQWAVTSGLKDLYFRLWIQTRFEEKKNPQEVKRQPGNTKCCVTMVSSWSPNHMNEDDK